MSEYQITDEVCITSEGGRSITLTVLAPTRDDAVALYREAKLNRARAESDVAMGIIREGE